MRVDYAMIPELHLAARRHRAEFIAGLFASAFAWLISRKPRLAHAARPHFAR
jgi:hypothetical protein